MEEYGRSHKGREPQLGRCDRLDHRRVVSPEAIYQDLLGDGLNYRPAVEPMDVYVSIGVSIEDVRYSQPHM